MVHALSPKVQPTALSDHSRSLEALRFIQALATEARALKAEVAASPPTAPSTIRAPARV